MRAAFVIAEKDVRQRIRDRSAIVIGFIAPVLIASVMSFAFHTAETFHLELAVVDADHGQVGDAIADALRGPELRSVVTVHSYRSSAQARRAVTTGKVDAALVIPAGFSAAASGPGAGDASAHLSVLTSQDRALAGEITRSIADGFAVRVNAARLSVATAIAAGAPAQDAPALAAASARTAGAEVLSVRPTGARTLRAVSYYAPGMAIFFLMFSIGFGSRSYFVEQRTGTLERMSAAVRPIEVVIGKALSLAVFGTASLATMVVVTSAAFGADWGGPLPAAAICLAMIGAVVCLTGLVTVVARTERQAEGLASIIVFGLALLGGNFVFVSASPPLMRKLALLTPNGWALRGFLDLSTGPHSLRLALGPVGGILAFSLVTTAVTVFAHRRAEAS